MSTNLLEKKPKQNAASLADRPLGPTRRKSERSTTSISTSPIVQAHPRTRTVTRRKKGNSAQVWALPVVTFVAVFSSTYVASSLTGHVMVERARQEELTAKDRALAATRAEARLRDHVDSLTSAVAVDAWAASQGFTPPDEQMTPTAKPILGRRISNLVARR